MRGAIHDFSILHMIAGTPDAAGRGAYQIVSTTTVRGRIAMLSAAEMDTDDRYQEKIHAIAVCPTGTVVAAEDRVLVALGELQLDGTYEIGSVRHTPDEIHVMLRRSGV